MASGGIRHHPALPPAPGLALPTVSNRTATRQRRNLDLAQLQTLTGDRRLLRSKVKVTHEVIVPGRRGARPFRRFPVQDYKPWPSAPTISGAGQKARRAAAGRFDQGGGGVTGGISCRGTAGTGSRRRTAQDPNAALEPSGPRARAARGMSSWPPRAHPRARNRPSRHENHWPGRGHRRHRQPAVDRVELRVELRVPRHYARHTFAPTAYADDQ